MPDQGDGGVQRVEEEMRSDPRLQFGQPRRRGGRQLAARSQSQRVEQRRRQGGPGEHRRPCKKPRGAADLRQADLPPAIGAAQRPQAHRSDPLEVFGHGGQGPLERTGNHEPQECRRQGHRSSVGEAEQPLAPSGTHEAHAHGHHGMHEEQRAQHHADVAGIEGRKRLRRGRGAPHAVEDGGRAEPAGWHALTVRRDGVGACMGQAAVSSEPKTHGPLESGR